MAYRVLYRKRAERGLDELAEYGTDEWFDGLCEAIEALGAFPHRGSLPLDAALGRRGVRQVFYGEGHGIYRILYRIRGESAQILTIRHGRRRAAERL